MLFYEMTDGVSSFYRRGWLNSQRMISLVDQDNLRFGIFANVTPPEEPIMRREGPFNDVLVENSRVRF